MFHEYRDVVTELKSSNAHFRKIFDEHNSIHSEIEGIENEIAPQVNSLALERMKKIKLKLKDEAYAIIMSHIQRQAAP